MKKYINNPEPAASVIGGFPVLYYGDLPQARSVFISTSQSLDVDSERALYAASLEAALMGFDVIYIPSNIKDNPIENGVFDGGGTLHAVIPFGLFNFNKRAISKIVIYGGSVISDSKEGLFSISQLNKAKHMAASLADCTVVGERIWNGNVVDYVQFSLDSGKDVGVLKCALGTPYMNRLALEGAPVLSSFSDFFVNAPLISYPNEKGRYSQRGFAFDIIRYEEL